MIEHLPSPAACADGAPVVPCAGPTLAEGYTVPEHGASRRDVFAAGLAAPWQVVAAFDGPERLRSQDQIDSFTVHLLSAGDRWAMVVIENSVWFSAPDRHLLMTRALEAAPAASTPSGLVQHYTGTDAAVEVPSGVRRGVMARSREPQRLDALSLLLGLDYPDRDADEFLLALSGAADLLVERRDRLAKTTALRSVARRVDDLLAALAATGVHRAGHKIYHLHAKARLLVEDHWDAEAGRLGPAHAAAERALQEGFFGNLLDDLVAEADRPAAISVHLDSWLHGSPSRGGTQQGRWG